MDVQRVTLHVHICSGRNRIVPLMRRPNTDSTPTKPVTLPRNQLLIRYTVTSLVHTQDMVLQYAVTLQMCTHSKMCMRVFVCIAQNMNYVIQVGSFQSVCHRAAVEGDA